MATTRIKLDTVGPEEGQSFYEDIQAGKGCQRPLRAMIYELDEVKGGFGRKWE